MDVGPGCCLSHSATSQVKPFASQPHLASNMDAMIRRWVLSLPPVRTQPHKGSESPSTSSRVVLLTGTTGTLGAAFLDALVHDPRIGHIYTLNRRPAVVDRQRSALAHRRLDPEIMTSSKITSLQGDVSQAGLGLDPPVLEKVK